MSKWLEICLEIIGFLVASYFLFYKSWLKSLGKEMAKLVTRKDIILIEENVKKDFNEKLESLKSSLAKENISHQIEFGYLHKRRAEVAVEIYQKLQELNSAAYDRTRPIHEVLEDGDKEELERQQRLHTAINEFKDFFVNNKIFFTESFCSEINGILRDFWRKGWEYNYKQGKIKSGVLQPEDRKDYLDDINKIADEINTKIPLQLNKIEKNIRNILKIE